MNKLKGAKVYRNKNSDVIKVKCEHHYTSEGIVKTTNIVEGMRVKIIPINPKKLRNRDRIGTVTGFTDQYGEVRAKVQFDDTKGIGKIEIEELVII